MTQAQDFTTYSKEFFYTRLEKRKVEKAEKEKTHVKVTEEDFEKFIFKKMKGLGANELHNLGKKHLEFRIVSQDTLNSHTGKLSNIADIVVYGYDNKLSALVVFELKMDHSIAVYDKGSLENAKRQLTNYCQLAKASYGVLMTESSVDIFEYKYNNAKPDRFDIDRLPHFHLIEDMLIERSKPQQQENQNMDLLYKQIDRIEANNKACQEEIIMAKMAIERKDKEIAIIQAGMSHKLKSSNKVLTRLCIAVFLLLLILLFPLRQTYKIYDHNSKQYPCKIKGNISASSGTVGKKFYYVPDCKYYDNTTIDSRYGERWFCTPEEAEHNGWTRAKDCPPK